jgi:hypothetical protein
MNERLENALSTLESEIARRFGLEHPVTIQTFTFTEEIRNAVCLCDPTCDCPPTEKVSWTLEELIELPEEERKGVLANLPQEETNKLTKEIFEADPVGLLISALMVSFMDEQ